VVSALFQLQFIPPADAHKLLGEHAMFCSTGPSRPSRGAFTFEKDAPSPPGAFALGHKWTLLAEAGAPAHPAPCAAPGQAARAPRAALRRVEHRKLEGWR